MKLIKIERSPSPIIILPSLSSAPNATNQSNNRIKVSRQSMQSWQLNNSHVNRRSVQQQKALTAIKTAGARRAQFALFASTIGGAHHHRGKTVKTVGKSTVITPMSSRSSTAAAAAAATTNPNQNGNTNDKSNASLNVSNVSATSALNISTNVNDVTPLSSAASTPDSSKGGGIKVKRESLNSSNDMIYKPDDEKPWSCKVCKRQYKWKNSLNCHIKNECGKPPKFFCERMCGYKTNIHSNMKRHMNSNCKPRFMQ